MKLYAPRTLYERTGCRSSRFTYTFAPVAAESLSLRTNGGACTTERKRMNAASTSEALTRVGTRAVTPQSCATSHFSDKLHPRGCALRPRADLSVAFAERYALSTTDIDHPCVAGSR